MVEVSEMTNEQLADHIHDLNDEFERRLRLLGSGLKKQLESARLTVRSWPSSKQITMNGCIFP